MELVIIITGLTSGGAEGMLVRLLKNLRKRYDIQVSVYTLKNVNFFKSDLEDIGINVINIYYGMSFKTIKEIFSFVNTIVKYRPVVNTWLYHADLFGGLIAKICGSRKIIWSIRQSNLQLEHNGFIKSLLIRSCSILSGKIPNLVISCSHNATNAHIGIGYDKNNIVMIPNGFDLEYFEKYRSSVKYSKLSIIHVGRYDTQKNQIGFLKLAQVIKSKYPKVDFLCVGNKVDSGNLELNKIINDLDLGGCVRLLGERRDVHELIAKSHCLISTSLGEGFPNVIAEAMLVGTPVIATNVGDTLDIVGSSEYIVDSFHVTHMVNKFELLMSKNNEELLFLIDRNRNRIKERYDINIIADHYLQSIRNDAQKENTHS